MRIFKYRTFSKWAKSEGISDKKLKEAIREMEEGIFDGNLGGGVYKKRVAKEGKGKRSGYRTIIAFKKNNRSFFIFGYAKNEFENINSKEESATKKAGKYFLEVTDSELNKLLDEEKLFEIK